MEFTNRSPNLQSQRSPNLQSQQSPQRRRSDPRSHRGPRRRPEIKVTGFPFAVNKNDLLDLFASFNAIDAEIQKNKQGSSRGFGHVLFPTPDLMRAAIHAKNDTMFRGKPIEVSESRRRPGSNRGHRSPRSPAPRSPRSPNGTRIQPPLLTPMELPPPHHSGSNQRNQPNSRNQYQQQQQQQQATPTPLLSQPQPSSSPSPSTATANIPIPEASFFFDPPTGTTGFRLLQTRLGTTFEGRDLPVHLERSLGRRKDRGRGPPLYALCHLLALPSEAYNGEDLTAFAVEDGGGGRYRNVNINSNGFNLSIESFLNDACQYDAQISMHVSFGRIGFTVPVGMLRGSNQITPARLCDGMASGKIKYFFNPILAGSNETKAAVECLLASGFVLHKETTRIDVRYVDGANCTVEPDKESAKKDTNNTKKDTNNDTTNDANNDTTNDANSNGYLLKSFEPSMEDVERADRRNPLLYGADLKQRVSNMRCNIETGRITMLSDDGSTKDIRMLGARFLDKQRTVTKRVYVSQSHGTYASLNVTTIYDFPDPTSEHSDIHPDLVESSLTITREHMRSLSANELKEHAKEMTATPPGFPVYQAYHFSGGMSCDARVWLSEIPPEKDGMESKPWTKEIGATTAFRTLEMSRSISVAVNKRCSNVEQERLEKFLAGEQQQQEEQEKQYQQQQQYQQQHHGSQNDNRRGRSGRGSYGGRDERGGRGRSNNYSYGS